MELPQAHGGSNSLVCHWNLLKLLESRGSECLAKFHVAVHEHVIVAVAAAQLPPVSFCLGCGHGLLVQAFPLH